MLVGLVGGIPVVGYASKFGMGSVALVIVILAMSTDLDMAVTACLCAVRVMLQDMDGLPTLRVMGRRGSETLLLDWSPNRDLVQC